MKGCGPLPAHLGPTAVEADVAAISLQLGWDRLADHGSD